jgi:hypothetical protein
MVDFSDPCRIVIDRSRDQLALLGGERVVTRPIAIRPMPAMTNIVS